jgi:hypothetical protein
MATNNLLRKPDLGERPGVDSLNNHFILGEMIENLGQLDPLYPNVEVGILIAWLKNVQDHQVDLESTMRKLLRTFQNTNAFKERFDPLDSETKAKITAFAGGKSAEDVVSRTGFQPKPIPASQTRFKGLDYHQPGAMEPAPIHPAKKSFWTKFQNLFGCFVQKIEDDEKSVALGVPSDLRTRMMLFSTRWGGGDRVVYEDIQKTKVMEVSFRAMRIDQFEFPYV